MPGSRNELKSVFHQFYRRSSCRCLCLQFRSGYVAYNKRATELWGSPCPRTWEPFLSEFITFPSSSTWDVDEPCVCDYDGKRVRQ